jgi:DNA (cytosine-5)-methyltransferase 1
MRYLSVCSGIEAASAAWEPLGWEPVAFSEIEPFPSAVLAHHYPNVPNLGNMTKYKEWSLGTGSIDLLVGGTPCQSFSIAGLRKGLADPRGNLMLVYLGILNALRPQWMVWENVPGVLSSNRGRDFGVFLGGLAELGYGFAYRVLDAQHFGVPQRRRRVFVVGYLGDWRPPAAVLFERHGLSGNPPPRREAGKGPTPILEAGARTGKSTTDIRAGNGQGNAEVVANGSPSLTCNHKAPIVAHSLRARANSSHREDSDTYVTHSLRGEGFDASEDGTGRGTPLVVNARQDPDVSSIAPAREAVAFAQNTRNEVREMDVVGALAAQPGMKQTSYIRNQMAVRRLTPRECERLQGFPDDWTLIPWRKGLAPDGPRYKACGNSMAVPVMRWIGKRIAGIK